MGIYSRHPAGPTFVLAATLSLSALGHSAAAQTAAARLQGHLVDHATSRGIAGGEIRLVSDGRTITTDSLGAFSFGALPGGAMNFVVSATGFPSTHYLIDIAAGGTAVRTIELDSTEAAGTASLPAVKSEADAPVRNYRLIDFERRRKTGRGQYLTESEITQSHASKLADLTRGMRGVDLDCSGHRFTGCRIHMARAPQGCSPDYVIDGRVNNSFGPSTPIGDIVALEVYTGPSDVPGEFAGTTAGCGVVVVWTRSGPTR